MTRRPGRAEAEASGAASAGREGRALERFARLFNARRYWDAHEALEGAWRESRSELYHGLILYASALVHAQRRNRHGVLAQLRKATGCLGGLRSPQEGVRLTRVLGDAERCRRHVEADGEWGASFPWPSLEIDGG